MTAANIPDVTMLAALLGDIPAVLTPAGLSCWRRLQMRWDRSSERFFAFVLLACALTCFKRL